MLKTNVDIILEMLQLNKPVAIGDISKKLRISEEVVEKIAKCLDEENILKLEYKFAKPFLVLTKPYKENELAAKEFYGDNQNISHGGQFAAEPENSNIKKLSSMLDSIEDYLEKKDFISAGNLYEQLYHFFSTLPDHNIKRDLYERIIKIYLDLIKSQKWKKKENEPKSY